jgi:hypothetical protein
MKTIVVFRYWQREVIALFPEEVADQQGNCSSFMHVGQHGAADYDHIVARSRPATPAEYKDLAKELRRSYGYNLDIRKRSPRGAYWNNYPVDRQPLRERGRLLRVANT